VEGKELPPAAPDLEALAEAIARHLAVRLRGDDRRLLDRGQLAGRLGVAERTVGALVARKELPQPLRLGGSVRWDWDEVLRFLGARRPRRPRRGRGVYDRHSKGG
jgi:predicted DNA-binding transcriptional regulator AlpA